MIKNTHRSPYMYWRRHSTRSAGIDRRRDAMPSRFSNASTSESKFWKKPECLIRSDWCTRNTVSEFSEDGADSKTFPSNKNNVLWFSRIASSDGIPEQVGGRYRLVR